MGFPIPLLIDEIRTNTYSASKRSSIVLQHTPRMGVQGRWRGSTDPPCDAVGARQVMGLGVAPFLPVIRARQTDLNGWPVASI